MPTDPELSHSHVSTIASPRKRAFRKYRLLFTLTSIAEKELALQLTQAD